VASTSSAAPKRLRVLACVLVLLTCLAAVGATCALCVTGHPGQAIEQSLISVPVAAVPPPVIAWSLLFVLALVPLVLVRPRVLSLGRASPAELQRFLF